MLKNTHLMDTINFLRVHQTQIRELNRMPNEIRQIAEIYKHIQPFLKDLETIRQMYKLYLKIHDVYTNKVESSFAPTVDDPIKPQEFTKSIKTRGPPQIPKKLIYRIFDFIKTYIVDALEFLVSWCLESELISYFPEHDLLISFIVFSVFFVLKYIKMSIEKL